MTGDRLLQIGYFANNIAIVMQKVFVDMNLEISVIVLLNVPRVSYEKILG